jgi:hypothetical protein
MTSQLLHDFLFGVFFSLGFTPVYLLVGKLFK